MQAGTLDLCANTASLQAPARPTMSPLPPGEAHAQDGKAPEVVSFHAGVMASVLLIGGVSLGATEHALGSGSVLASFGTPLSPIAPPMLGDHGSELDPSPNLNPDSHSVLADTSSPPVGCCMKDTATEQLDPTQSTVQPLHPHNAGGNYEERRARNIEDNKRKLALLGLGEQLRGKLVGAKAAPAEEPTWLADFEAQHSGYLARNSNLSGYANVLPHGKSGDYIVKLGSPKQYLLSDVEGNRQASHHITHSSQTTREPSHATLFSSQCFPHRHFTWFTGCHCLMTGQHVSAF